MKALALLALLGTLVTACGPSDGTHFVDTEATDGQGSDTGSDSGTDSSLGAPTGGFEGEPRNQSSSDGLAAAGSSGLGNQPTGGSGGSGDSDGGFGGGSSDGPVGSGGTSGEGSSGGSGGSDSGSGGSGAGSAGSTDTGSSGGSGGAGGAGDSSGGSGGTGSGSGGGSGGSDTSGVGGGIASCPNPRTPEGNTVPNGSSGHFGTTESVCYRLDYIPAEYAGWGCSNAADRTVTINDTEVSCGDMPLPEPVMGAYFFEFSAGGNVAAGFHWFNW